MRFSAARVEFRLVVVAVAALVAACAGPAARSSSSGPGGEAPSVASSPSKAGEEFSGLVSVGSRKLFLQCRGSGSPTVVLESGFRDAADIWRYTDVAPTPVFAGTATFTRVCAWDRPGSIRSLGDDDAPAVTPLPSRSGPAGPPRTGAEVVAELHGLLAAAQVPGPFVLVGHSLGGLFSLLYARTYPDQVSGLVLVDPTVPTIKKLLTPAQWAEAFRAEAVRSESAIPDFAAERFDLDTTLDQVETAKAAFAKPVVLLAAGMLEPDAPAAVKAMWPRLQQAHARFVKSSPRTKLITVPDTTHYIHTQSPDVVIDAIRSLKQ